MKIAILGGGFTGLSAAYYLSKNNHEIFLFEKEKDMGGLASSFQNPSWQWPLEKYYHHLFLSDHSILKLARSVNHPLLSIKPTTAIYYQNNISRFDTPASLLTFKYLNLPTKLRTAAVISFLKANPLWQPLESDKAKTFLQRYNGQEAWQVLWEPLFIAKFGNHINKIPASWFWARIKKRSNRFIYPKGGFNSLVNSIIKQTSRNGCKFVNRSEATSIYQSNNQITVKFKKHTASFDRVLCTFPLPVFLNITRGLPKKYLSQYQSISNRGTVNLVIELHHKFLPDNIYWLNINDTSFPFLGVVEHTNFISSKYYHHRHIIYLANYFPTTHPYFRKSKNLIIKDFLPYLQKLNPSFKLSWINQSWKFTSLYAQPIMTTNYSRKIPSFQTPIKNLFIANMQQIHPWDRQTNYAVAMGSRVAELIRNS